MSYNFFKLLRRFAAETRANLALMTAFSAIPMIGAAGVAVDYVYADNMRTKMLAAVDASALAGGQLMTGTPHDRQKQAQAVFESSMGMQKGLKIVSVNGRDIRNGSSITGYRVEAQATTDTFFARVFGRNTVDLSVRAEITIGSFQYVEVALVLDVTGSMEGQKLAALKAAASDLVNVLAARATLPDQVRFSLVPFSEYVNIGKGMAGKPWLSIPAPVFGTYCWVPEISRSNCRIGTITGFNDGVNFSREGEVCDILYGPKQCVAYMDSWEGCVGSRNSPLDSQDGSYTTPVPGVVFGLAFCPGEIIPLTSNKDTVINAINAMTASGETYMPSGLMWGWRTLSPGEPYGETKKGVYPNAALKRYLILMTDGINTKSASYPDAYHSGTNTAAANTLVSTICTNIKGTNGRGAPKDGEIGIFTIAFDVSDATVNSLLRTCASQDTYYYSATGAAQLASAFAGIGAQMSALRLSK